VWAPSNTAALNGQQQRVEGAVQIKALLLPLLLQLLLPLLLLLLL
jgi:hypothetical protein